jgi:hypothetical protein
MEKDKEALPDAGLRSLNHCIASSLIADSHFLSIAVD